MHQSSSSKRHPLALEWRVIYMLGTIGFPVLELLTLMSLTTVNWEKSTSGHWLLLFAILLLYPLLFALSLYGPKTQIITSPTGLAYHGSGIKLYSAWENIEQIGPSGPLARWGIGAKSLILRQPPQLLSDNWLGRLLIRLYSHPAYYIPLIEFGRWRSTDLGQEIRKYAPRLLGEKDSPTGKATISE